MQKKLYLKPINKENVDYWISMPFWDLSEAIKLSMSTFSEDTHGDNVSEEQAIKFQEDHEYRIEILNRANQVNQIQFINLAANDQVNPRRENAVEPVSFVKWSIKNLPSFPEELLKAIQQKYPNEFREDYPSGSEKLQVFCQKSQPTIREDDDTSFMFVFKQKGDLWSLVYEGKETNVKHSIGMIYIREILKKPGSAISATCLYEAAGKINPDSIKAPGNKIPRTFMDQTSFIEDLQERKVRNIKTFQNGPDPGCRKILKDIVELEGRKQDASDKNDHAEVESLKSEIKDLKNYIKTTYDSRGQIRNEDIEETRRKKAISKAIYRSIVNIENKIPELGQYIRKSIILKGTYTYSPSPGINWVF